MKSFQKTEILSFSKYDDKKEELKNSLQTNSVELQCGKTTNEDTNGSENINP